MSDYTELVKKLRNRRVCIQSGGSLGEDFPLMREAADAIEKLSTEVECLKSYMGEYKAAYIAEHDARMMEYKELDINPCRGCEDYEAPDGCKSKGGCGRPQTNADRIRAMTDEELAEWVDETACAAWCPDDPPTDPMTHDCLLHDGDCTLCILDWLKAPVEVDDEPR